MAGIEVQGLVDSVNHIEAVKILLERLQNEDNLGLLKHKPSLQRMVGACRFLVVGIRRIDRDLRAS